MAGGYIIQVGPEKPSAAANEVVIATPNKKGQPVGEQMQTFIKPGGHLILNTATVWGRRIIREADGKIKKTVGDVEFNTAGYKGEIEFMEWGGDGGYAIQIRYLERSRSLDLEYQSNVQKIVVLDSESTHIHLKSGQNKFDLKKDELLVTFLKVIPANGNSVSKNPNPQIKSHVYSEVTDEHVDKKSIERIESSANATNIVKGLSTKPEQIRNLFSIMGKRDEFGSTDELSGDQQIYKTLLQYAHGYPEDFFYRIEEYNRSVREAFERAESYKALDLTKDGHISIEVKDKKELPYAGVDIKGKGNAMIEWVLDHFLESDVYKGTQILFAHVSKLK